MKHIEEGHLVKDYTFLIICLDVLERDIKALEQIELKMKSLYIDMLREAQQKITNDITNIRKIFRERGVKVYESTRSKKEIEVKYICRGYHETFGMQSPLVRAETHRYLEKYLINNGQN